MSHCTSCKNTSLTSNKKISFHRFPIMNEILLSKWLKAMNKENFTPNKFSKLCGAHFKPESKKKKLEIPINNLEVEGLEEPVKDNSPKTSTSYPKVYVILDVCHMMKLLRNLLG
ncbi:unnamed protein product [Gordionus sp. m RMFG-2023]